MSTETSLPERAPPSDPRGRAWIEIRASALRENYRTVQAAVGPDVGMIPMVKADGYGLGVEGVVRALRGQGPLRWGVATVDEGLRLRELGVTEPIQVFSPAAPAERLRALEGRLRPTLSDLDFLSILTTESAEGRARGGSRGLVGRFDVEVDTGMGRSGFAAGSVADWAPAIFEGIRGSGLEWAGVFTHLHSADDPEGVAAGEAVGEQLRRFQTVLRQLDMMCGSAGRPLLERHVANSAGALRFPGEMSAFDAVRPGIALYGGSVGADTGLADVVAVRARVIRVVDVTAGTTVGYASTYRARKPETWATLGIGYGDGLPRALSNRGSAIVAERRVPIIGRISMDMTVVDVTGIEDLTPGDVATLVGTSGAVRISLADVAEEARTIDYEILTGWTSRLPRIWTED
ncbi:MAG: alanine racemase [Gemmatimonadales bacterium]|nr:MAG: alanine racemase [Gemmatimonadales bacterium]